MRADSAHRARSTRRGRAGFTILELMIALTVLIIGISGILAMQMTGLRSSAYSRHATEATVLAEDGMERLRTVPLASVVDGTETVDEQGVQDPGGYYTRGWAITNDGTYATLTVTVSWLENGAEPHAVTLTTLRVL